MFGDARSIEDGATLTTDLCVVGAGAAGIALARAFSRYGIDTYVVEAGGMDLDFATQELYRGEAIGRPLPHDYLVRSRLRQFGGTTNHWGGATLAMGAHVFGERPAVPDGAWPFSKRDLDPYYEEAALYLGATRPYQPAPPPSPEVPFTVVDGYPIERLRPAVTYRKTLEESTSVRVLLYGNVVELQTERDGGRLGAVKVATLTGTSFTVRARAFVLATGAIENARLLLQPTDAHPQGVGNEHDIVGRYFSEHIFLLTGRAVRTSTDWPMFAALSPELQARHELLDAGIQLRKLSGKPDEIGRQLAPVAQALDESTEPSDVLRAVLSGEVLPSRENRVALAPERDELGLRRCRLRFEIGDQDRRSFEETQAIAARIIGERAWGRLSPASTDGPVGLGSHHMSTTRMHPDPRLGVVDGDCRVHSLSNLFIAGSSVFPSTGLVNPTFTLVALAYRLVDHLRRGLRDGRFN